MPLDKQALSQQLTDIFRREFDDENLVVAPEMTAADVDNWDSLTHINLITAVERQFKVRFTTSEVTSMKNVGDLMALIQKKAN